jgi:hypothetical protein
MNGAAAPPAERLRDRQTETMRERERVFLARLAPFSFVGGGQDTRTGWCPRVAAR